MFIKEVLKIQLGCVSCIALHKKLHNLKQNLKSSCRSKRYIMVWRQYLMCRLVRAQTCSSRQDTTAASEATSASDISSHSPPPSHLKPFNVCIVLGFSLLVRVSIDLMKPFICIPSKTSDSFTEVHLASSSFSQNSKWFWDQGLGWLYHSTPLKYSELWIALINDHVVVIWSKYCDPGVGWVQIWKSGIHLW